VLVYGINFWPELTGVGKYTGEMCHWLAARGHDVHVVTAPPYYPAWQVAEGYRALSYRTERRPAHVSTHSSSYAPSHVTRCPLWVPREPGALKRLLHLASFAVSSLPVLWARLRHKPDVLLVVAPTLIAAPGALALARLHRVPTWLHVQDFEVDAMFSLGMGASSGRLRRVALACESRLLQAFGRISTITPRMVDRLVSKGVCRASTVEFPNWVNLDSIFPLAGTNAFRAELGIGDEEFVVLYAGNMGEKQGLDLLVDVARSLQSHRHIRFVFAGDGAARQRLQAAAQGLDRVHWLPLQPQERLNELLNAADVHALPQRADAADLVMPSKLTGMLASGRATLGTAARDTQLGQVLDAVGRRVEPGDGLAFAQALLELTTDRAALRWLGAQGRRYAQEHLGLEPIMTRFEQALLGFVRPEAPPP
jgi:colanic acid biosynthesis glycosyl transferase WcaI